MKKEHKQFEMAWGALQILGLAVVLIVLPLAFLPGRAQAATAKPASGSPTPILNPLPGTGNAYLDQTNISVTVGANSLFTPGQTVNILECADPGGTAGNLPTSDGTCDGLTVQGDTLYIANDGSFSESAYTVYQLPSRVLDESPGGQPKCDASDECVLFVGEDQTNFSAPHVFSQPFFMTGGSVPTTVPQSTTTSSPSTTTTTPPTTTTSGGTTTTTSGGTTTTSGGTTTTTRGGSTTTTTRGHGTTTSTKGGPTTTSDPSGGGGGGGGGGNGGGGQGSGGGLAFTGAPPVGWLLGLGFLLVLAGSLGRRLARPTAPRRS